MAIETRKPTAAIAPFGLRMQPDLKERVEAAAHRNGRSVNAEIVAVLEEAFPPDPTVDDVLREIHSLLERSSDEHTRISLQQVREKFLRLKELRDARR